MSRISEFSNDKIKSTIVNLEHYMRIQWFLERLGIKYFMANSHPSAKISERNGIMDNPYVKFLRYGLDYFFWLQSNSLYIDCQNRRIPVNNVTKLVSTEGHEYYTKVIINHLIYCEFINPQ